MSLIPRQSGKEYLINKYINMSLIPRQSGKEYIINKYIQWLGERALNSEILEPKILYKKNYDHFPIIKYLSNSCKEETRDAKYSDKD